MDHFAGLDVSVKETSVCIVDDTGKMLARQFPGACSNAVISSPLYCIADRCVFTARRKGEQRLAANLTTTTQFLLHVGFSPT